MTSIEYVPKGDSLKVFVRMYFDDFVRDCKLSGTVVDGNTFSSADTAWHSIIQNYVSSKIILVADEKQLHGNLKDMDMAENELSMNLDFRLRKHPGTFSVKNLIMTGLYPDMSNMVMIKINDYEEGIKLTSDITEQTIKLYKAK